MPFWYIHMEAAKQAVDRLRAGDVPADFPGGPKRAKELGEIAHKWRNYLALGAIGPDLFYFVPDYRQSFARNDLATFVYWFRTKWDQFEKLFLKSWNQYAQPAVGGEGAVLNQMSGGLLRELGEAQQEIARAAANLLLDVVANLWHWFGLFGSGVSSGVSEKEFFWSDMFHYRKTYTFARKLFENAQLPDFQQNMTSEQLQAFAIGWMTHCATDVTGHPFVNEKVGGPWRLHWQRHHVVEFHMDARVYDTQHGGMEPYGELDTSCSHFRVAFRNRNDGDYATPDGKGFNDAPPYDYFAGFPPYDTTLSDIGDINRGIFFDLPTGGPTRDLYKLLIDTMKEIYSPNGDTPDTPAPQILRCSKIGDGDSGRPNENTLEQTVGIVYDFLKAASIAGYSPAPPSPPPIFNDHRPPPFPQPNEDPARGSDPQQNQLDNIIAVFFAVYGFIRWLGDFGLWLATLPDQLLADLLTYPARQLLYEYAVNPLYSLYIAMRQPLVMSGFLIPKRNEISLGLIQLGVSPSAPVADLVAALASPGAVFPEAPPTTEPSGRATPVEGFAPALEVDQEYPRDAIVDRRTLIESILFQSLPKEMLPCHIDGPQPSEYLRSWRYPFTDNEKHKISHEKERTHAGPWFQGQLPEILMNGSPGDSQTRAAFEAAKTPEDTESLCEKNFPYGKHLGDPVDYGVYLVGRLTNNNKNASFPPDFNLDSDRGYAYHCWDWKRTNTWIESPDNCPPPDKPVKFNFLQPCTVPQGFCNWLGGKTPNYDPTKPRQIFYLDGQKDSPVCEGNVGGNVVPR